jgi:UDP-N-acetylglucosamine 2-epimerase (non-hydrolysing)
VTGARLGRTDTPAHDVAASATCGPTRRVLFILGTRPEAIKLAPLVLGMNASAGIDVRVAVTAQHDGLLAQALEAFCFEPDLHVGSYVPGRSLADLTVSMLAALPPVLEAERPDAVIVQGDTTTSFAGALAAFYAGVPVVHLEAGLRTGDRTNPFPEEANRRLIASLATLHLAPTQAGRDNLLREGIDPASIVVTGNTVIDALHLVVGTTGPLREPWLADLEIPGRRMVLVTAHRRESWSHAMSAIGAAVADIARTAPDVQLVLPLHPNPAVRSVVGRQVAGLPNVRVGDPVCYRTFIRLLRLATLVLTDSGGVQEEASAVGKPVLVMRTTTERTEGLIAGTARLVGTERRSIVRAALELLTDAAACARMSNAPNLYGDGSAAQRAVAAICGLLGNGTRVADFRPGPPGEPLRQTAC